MYYVLNGSQKFTVLSSLSSSCHCSLLQHLYHSSIMCRMKVGNKISQAGREPQGSWSSTAGPGQENLSNHTMCLRAFSKYFLNSRLRALTTFLESLFQCQNTMYSFYLLRCKTQDTLASIFRFVYAFYTQYSVSKMYKKHRIRHWISDILFHSLPPSLVPGNIFPFSVKL